MSCDFVLFAITYKQTNVSPSEPPVFKEVFLSSFVLEVGTSLVPFPGRRVAIFKNKTINFSQWVRGWELV